MAFLNKPEQVEIGQHMQTVHLPNFLLGGRIDPAIPTPFVDLPCARLKHQSIGILQVIDRVDVAGQFLDFVADGC